MDEELKRKRRAEYDPDRKYKCYHCKQKISPFAEVCPSCGEPDPTKQWDWFRFRRNAANWLGFLLFSLFLFFILFLFLSKK